MRRTVRYAASLLLLFVTTAGVALASDDPFIGKWSFDPAHSKYQSGAVPTSMTVTMEAAENGVHYHSITTFSNGRSTTSDYTADYDGHLAIVAGEGGFSIPVSLKRVDAHTVEASYKRALRVVATARRVVSNDGSTMTITTTEMKDEKTTTNVSVFHRAK